MKRYKVDAENIKGSKAFVKMQADKNSKNRLKS